MTRRHFSLFRILAIGMATLFVASVAVAGQDQTGTWSPPRTVDGQPDLQGVWANNTATPLERPEALAGKETLTDEEVAELKAKAAEVLAGDGDAIFGDRLIEGALANVTGATSSDTGTGNYNHFWLVERDFDNQTSLVVDPPDGQIPSFTPEAETRRAERAAYRSDHPADSWTDRDNSDRCYSYGFPRISSGYNSYFQILQTPDHVVVLQELIHDARVIPLDQRPPVDEAIRQWHGDSRGRWEGDSLIVETANYSSTASLYGASRHSRVTERFTRVGPDTVEYIVTYDDPETWTQPWTVMIPLKKSAPGDAVYEYACHEGNYAMEGILAGARKQEAEGR
jgi:hypothetical protein